MQWLNKLLGKDEKVEFAKAVLKQFSTKNPQMRLTLDIEGFQILVTNAEGCAVQTIYLDNLYTEYLAAPPATKRSVIENCYKGLLTADIVLPKTYEEAMPLILPRMRPRTEWMAQNLQIEIEQIASHGKTAKAGKNPVVGLDSPFRAMVDFYACGLCIDLPQAVMYVNDDQLQLWGRSFDELLEVATKNLAAIDPQKEFFSPIPGVHISTWRDTHDASRILLTDIIRGLAVRGGHVAMIPNRNMLIVTGSEDVDGLSGMLKLIEQVSTEPRAMPTIPLFLVGNEWREFCVPPDHALFGDFKKHRIMTDAACYNIQGHALKRFFDKQHRDVFVATYMVFEKHGRLMSACTWTKGVEAYLPKAEFITFTDGSQMVAKCKWEKVNELAGDLLRSTDYYPARYHVSDFPSPAQIKLFGNEF